MVEYITLCVDTVFGYASVSVDWIEEHAFDWRALAAEREWRTSKGLFNITFLRGKAKPILEFGHRPDQKQMRVMVKEAKQKTTDE